MIFVKINKQINKRIRGNRTDDSDETASYEGESVNRSQMEVKKL
jgi:hypothetical protein